ncbi:hypothetical protein Y032_0568g50 [Ancylostoma ceylanicum]|uniref:Uncharacterized protein n=1 Tax=Ancylostoma ceylanicum TaxID=53326 RepID=A0A016WNS6_9BILA|nr:hypothetical protein Y032_0568g50 [Ancylostoma ceylanicum]
MANSGVCGVASRENCAQSSVIGQFIQNANRTALSHRPSQVQRSTALILDPRAFVLSRVLIALVRERRECCAITDTVPPLR